MFVIEMHQYERNNADMRRNTDMCSPSPTIEFSFVTCLIIYEGKVFNIHIMCRYHTKMIGYVGLSYVFLYEKD